MKVPNTVDASTMVSICSTALGYNKIGSGQQLYGVGLGVFGPDIECDGLEHDNSGSNKVVGGLGVEDHVEMHESLLILTQ